jgi:hypothetical protein
VNARAKVEPANTNACLPIVILKPTGDGSTLYRALARVIVRRELIFATAISDAGDCDDARAVA